MRNSKKRFFSRISNYLGTPQFTRTSLVTLLSILVLGTLYMWSGNVYSQDVPITPPITSPEATPTPTSAPSGATPTPTSAPSGTTDSTSAGKAPVCSDSAPSNTPELFQIDVTSDSAKLYFTPANDYVSYYFIAYGLTTGDMRFGTTFSFGSYNGVISYKISNLAPNTTYYFTVRAGNGCAPGKWSNWLQVKTTQSKNLTRSFYLYH